MNNRGGQLRSGSWTGHLLAALVLGSCGQTTVPEESLLEGSAAGRTGSSSSLVDAGVGSVVPGQVTGPTSTIGDLFTTEDPVVVEDPCVAAGNCDWIPAGDAGPACGDGVITGNEACDDGNGVPGDGCSGTCQVEPNFACDAAGAVCVSTILCGDAVRAGAEVCDDGNTNSGDGCTADCSAVEGSFGCPANGGPCASNVVCGDSRVTGAEACDDGNILGDDGCAADCLIVSAGFNCSTPGQLCVVPIVCGDGTLSVGEQCDDSNTDSGDGCTTGCFREAFYVCDVAGEACVSLVECGDGVLMADEQCDDANAIAGDGCDEQCQVEAGWQCPDVGIRCDAMSCGDGIVAGDEQCEDGNGDPGDGCADCQREVGFECAYDAVSSPPSLCHATVCNDGIAEGDEPCDDGNNVVGDGCNPFCQVEPTCGPSGCTSACGDGLRLPGDSEACDDGNTQAGDGCSPTCQVEPGYECEDVTGTLPPTFNLPVTFRDFIASPLGGASRHPDFEIYSGGGTSGLVETTLGVDGKPVYTGLCENGNVTGGSCPSGAQTTSESDFDDWYRDVPAVNRTLVTTLPMTQPGAGTPGTYQFPETFGSSFFPFDNAGWVGSGNEANIAGHNFAFTSEIRHWFEFQGGELLTFSGDDDVWIFINGKLALDLGGMHSRLQSTIVLNAATGEADCTTDVAGTTPCAVPTRDLGLVTGTVYEMVLLHAERHGTGSNFDLTLGGFVNTVSECASFCGDGVRTPDEVCDDGVNDNSYGSCTALCGRGPHCGDGQVQGAFGELCDNGSNTTGYGDSGCAPGCVDPGRCGDGQVDGSAGETCDDGINDNSYGSCTASCQPGPRCGDGQTQQAGGEQCDDGVNDGSYGTCAPGCLLGPRCGDGNTQAVNNEQCDDGANVGGYGQCQPSCLLGPRCGDGDVQTAEGEQCDNGVNDGGYGECQPSCQLGPRCGDGQRQQANGEQCDDGINDGGYGECAAGCRVGPRCGDDVLQAQEQCDDGNRTAGDGCSPSCTNEVTTPQ